jgi:Ca2+-binding EF-hand superfamily protein
MPPKAKPSKALTEDQILQLKSAFDYFDSDKSGSLDSAEMIRALKIMGIPVHGKSEIQKIKDLGQPGTGKMEFKAWCAYMVP